MKKIKEEIIFKFWQMEGNLNHKKKCSYSFKKRLPTLICLIYQIYFYNENVVIETSNFFKKFLLVSYLGIYSSNCGDTWSSEVGILSKSEPFHILTWKPVPYGTNGGVSKLGILASLTAGICLGLITSIAMFFTTELKIQTFLLIMLISTFSSVFGSILDSILGSLFEYSGYCTEKKKIVKVKTKTTKDISGSNILSGDAVNFISGTIIGIFVGLLMKIYQ